MPDSRLENGKHMAGSYKGDLPVFPTKLSTGFVDKKKYAFDAKEFKPFAHPPSQKAVAIR
ncbi:MAG: hypothetical protein EKK49_07650 [Rhodocyclaceae bacterium]|nr:MAG: hypothetical protein EKK49_07650 [Rhodocyclaceae bacterium]